MIVCIPPPPSFTRKVTGNSKAADAKKKRGRKGKESKETATTDRSLLKVIDKLNVDYSLLYFLFVFHKLY
jgi:hypothetical protein